MIYEVSLHNICALFGATGYSSISSETMTIDIKEQRVDEAQNNVNTPELVCEFVSMSIVMCVRTEHRTQLRVCVQVCVCRAAQAYV